MKMKKILLIRLSSLGDIIFNIPLANVLKRSGYEVHWIVGPKGIDVLKGNPCVDKIIYIPKKLNLKECFDVIKQLRAEKYDIAIDTHGLLKSAIFTMFCGAKRRIVGTDARECTILAGNEVAKIPKDDFSKHISKKYLQYAKHLGLDIKNAPVTLPDADKKTKAKISRLLPKGKPVAVICPATTWDNKHWNKDHWKTLVKAIAPKYNLIFTGTANDKKLIKYISNGIGLNLAGKTNIKELIALFKRADLVVSLDSGSTHLAWAAGAKKIVAIFCATPKTLYTPPGHKGLSGKLKCQPCHSRRCKFTHMSCTKKPDPKEVIKACL
jgi:ADP-heptose:LPS heptosyltransferase